MRACGESTALRPATWITDDFLRSYAELHRRGLAHSVEVWEGEELVGGLYGVALGGFFGGESMFSTDGRTPRRRLSPTSSNACGAAGGFTLLDAQVQTPHLERLGATTIPRADYLGPPPPRRPRLSAPQRGMSDRLVFRCQRASGRGPDSGSGATQTRFLPERLAVYIVSSATATRSEGDSTPTRGARATPTLIVTAMGFPSWENDVLLDRLAPKPPSASAGALATSVPREITANSSPP